VYSWVFIDLPDLGQVFCSIWLSKTASMEEHILFLRQFNVLSLPPTFLGGLYFKTTSTLLSRISCGSLTRLSSHTSNAFEGGEGFKRIILSNTDGSPGIIEESSIPKSLIYLTPQFLSLGPYGSHPRGDTI
jgi:hypothetical protein